MSPQAFRALLAAFADNPEQIDTGRDTILFELHDELIEIHVERTGTQLQVSENGQTMSADDWVAKRLARLPLLADRILDNLAPVHDFVPPTGDFLDDLSNNPSDDEEPVNDVLEQALEWIDRGSTFMSRVLYLTSDAGEGKTTIINHAARIQATRYKQRHSNWLLVPVSLGGRPFLRLDEMIIGSLGNRFRFQLLYYDAFLELVKLGFIVLALDGFEEMFVEGAAGDAVSSLGNLMAHLDSQGTVLIAARKAYFEYKSLDTTAKLFDTLRDVYVDFARLRISRWDVHKFTKYCSHHDISDPDKLHARLSAALGSAEHPLLTRPVLVRHLVRSVGTSEHNLNEMLAAVTPAEDDYYGRFVREIIQREAEEKWIDKSGEPFGPLLTVDEHFDLLSFVADEMWTGETETLKAEFLDLAADQFCEASRKSSVVADQVKERVKAHALVVSCDDQRGFFRFDHQEFYHYFLGLAVARECLGGRDVEISRILRQSALPRITLDSVLRQISDPELQHMTITVLNDISEQERSYSVLRQNASTLATALALRVQAEEPIRIVHGVIGRDVLSAAPVIRNLHFERCFIMPQVLRNTTIENCVFDRCEIESLEIHGIKARDVRLTNGSSCAAITIGDESAPVFDPSQIVFWLQEHGFTVEGARTGDAEGEAPQVDPELALAMRFFRVYGRATGVNENVLRMRLGAMNSTFVESVLPQLMDAGVVEVVEYRGSGTQQRYSLSQPLRDIQRFIEQCGGSFPRFIELASR